MTKEEIQKLIEELESLRKENLDLKITVGLPSPEIINGYPAPAKIQEDAILKGLRNQIDALKQTNKSLRQALAKYDDVERSLATLLPALEVQMKGQTTEIYHLKLNIDQTENTFAGVVRKLEQQIKLLRENHQREKEQMQLQFEQEILRIKSESESKLPVQKTRKKKKPAANAELPKVQNPFTDLNIFEI
ncbi:MAG: hypothetical protein AAF587_28170 [Bacteroidota bacterium]